MRPLEEMGRYATVVIDPPWPYRSFGYASEAPNGLDKPLPYEVTSVVDIKALPMPGVLQDDARVFVWTCNGFLAAAFDLLLEWGLQYTFTMTWVKRGGIQTPDSPMFNAEWCVVGRKGRPKYLTTKAFMTANVWPRGDHSEKPEEFYDLLRRVTPEPRLDIFGRRRIAGFQSWGNEAPEGEVTPGWYQDVLLEAV